MTIVTQGGDTTEALDFKYIFMVSLGIFQSEQYSSPPVYDVKINYKPFAEDSQGVRHYWPKTKHIHIEDYLRLASEKAAAGDTDLLVAIQSIEKALASIIADQGEYIDVSVTP